MGVGVIVGVAVGSGSVVAGRLGIISFWPIVIMAGSAMPLACWIACTEVPYFRPMRYKFSPSCTVCMIVMPVAGPALVAAGRAAAVVAAGAADRAALAPADAPCLAQPLSIKSAT